MAALLAGGTPARADDAATARLWAVTRAGDGRLHVVRGMRAAIARMDVQLGRTDTQVLSTEDDRPVSELGDPLRPQQWALDQTSFELAWPTVSGSGVTVAVVDTGVLAAHEDLAGAVVAGTDLASDAHSVDPFGTGMVDPAGHGTHVAGIIGARVNNGRGIAGAAPNVKILPVRVLDAHGTGVASNVAEGIIWAADHGARVINLSLGGGPSPGMETAMQYANGKGVRERADLPGCISGSNRCRVGESVTESFVVLEYRLVCRHRGSRRDDSLDVQRQHARLRVDERDIDGDPLRVGRSRAHRRYEPVTVGCRHRARARVDGS
jgi:hypothetical protein